MIEETKIRIFEAPVILPDRLTQVETSSFMNDNIGRRISLNGIFQHDKEILLGPRSAPAGLLGSVAQGLATNPQGFFVITPFQMSSG